MPRTVQPPDPITTVRTRLRAAEQATSDVVLAVESLRTALRQAVAALDDLPRDRAWVPASPPAPPPRPKRTDPPTTQGAPRFLRSKEVTRLCGLSRTTIWRMASDGKFPQRRRITARTVGWLTEEVEGWIRTRERGL